MRAALGENLDAAAGNDFQPVCRLKFQTGAVAFPHHATEGGPLVLEGKIKMPRRGM